MEMKKKMTASDPVVGAAGKRSSYVKHYRRIIAEIPLLFNGFYGFSTAPGGKEAIIEPEDI